MCVCVCVCVRVRSHVLSTPLMLAILTTFMPVSLLFLRLDLSSRLCARVDLIKTTFPDPVILNLFAADFLVFPAFATVVTARTRPPGRALIHSEDPNDATPAPCTLAADTRTATAEQQQQFPLLQLPHAHRPAHCIHALLLPPCSAFTISNRLPLSQRLASHRPAVLFTPFTDSFLLTPLPPPPPLRRQRVRILAARVPLSRTAMILST